MEGVWGEDGVGSGEIAGAEVIHILLTMEVGEESGEVLVTEA